LSDKIEVEPRKNLQLTGKISLYLDYKSCLLLESLLVRLP